MRSKEVVLVVLILLYAALVIPVAIGTLFPESGGAGSPDSASSRSSADLRDTTTVSADDDQTFGAESNPTGSPIGGGEGYGEGVPPPDPEEDTIVATADELFAALSGARSGDVIYIDEMARIDLTDTPGGVTIPGGVTLAGNRGERSTAGSAVYPFEIEEPGEYYLRVLVSASGEESTPIWVSIDEEDTWRRDIEPGSDWHWSWGDAHYLSSGRHTMTIHWRENGLKLDEILIADDPDYLPDAAGQTGEVHSIEAESGELSPMMKVNPDAAASGGAYLSITDDPDGEEHLISPGGTIFQGVEVSGSPVALIAGGEYVRITGIRLEGPDMTTRRERHPGLGIYSAYRNLEVDNCEILGWSGTAIGIAGTGGSDMQTGGYIHHNYIHHCQMKGLGYGVVVSGGAVSLIEANYFDYCRHAIAGSGVAGDGYEARYNICGPNWISTSPHNFDMHGTTSGSTTIAGDTIKIHHNTFMATGPLDAFPIAIRGVPRDGAYIDHNWFHYDLAPPVWQTGGEENVFVTDNLIGPNGDLSISGPIEYY